MWREGKCTCVCRCLASAFETDRMSASVHCMPIVPLLTNITRCTSLPPRSGHVRAFSTRLHTTVFEITRIAWNTGFHARLKCLELVALVTRPVACVSIKRDSRGRVTSIWRQKGCASHAFRIRMCATEIEIKAIRAPHLRTCQAFAIRSKFERTVRKIGVIHNTLLPIVPRRT